ncbi:MAG: 50S ribosomal protein L24 [Chitinophagales bacterium]
MANKKEQSKRFKPKYRIKKGDTVVVITGEDKGTEGRVLTIDTETGRAVVEGVNIITRHTKPNNQYPEGGLIEREAPIQISNVMLVDPKTGSPTRVGRRTEDGKIVRYSKKSGEVIS